MDKRGQFFIFVAIILALLVFTLVSKSNTIREQVSLENFEELSQNYLTESPKVINYAIYSVQSPEDKLSQFSEKFIHNYARNNDPNIGILYAYNNPDPKNQKLVIQNLLKGEKVVIDTPGAGEQPVFLFNTDEGIEGDLCIEETGTCIPGKTNLCENIVDYCLLSGSSLSGTVTLKVGDVSYDFNFPAKTPSFIVVVRSTEGQTTKVDISQTTI